MTPEQVSLITRTFSQVAGQKDKVGAIFYERLFAIAPETRPMFRGDMDAQSRKLMDTLALAIGMLRDMPALMATLEALAIRHQTYGVRDEHYAKVGEALIWTLEQGLASSFTHEAREAWRMLYGTVAATMQGAVKKAAVGAS